jgi:hypothetical protein
VLEDTLATTQRTSLTVGRFPIDLADFTLYLVQ